jgi:hypothetical protein
MRRKRNLPIRDTGFQPVQPAQVVTQLFISRFIPDRESHARVKNPCHKGLL